jgi:outer membrane protein assembly factor BamB
MKRILAIAAVAVVCSWIVAEATDDPASNWPNWRGPQFSGVAPYSNPPTEWAETKNIRWKVSLPGPGHASPVVWGKRVYVLSSVKTDQIVELPPPPEQESRGGRSRPPRPDHVYKFVVSALDRATGKTVWETAVQEEVPHEAGHSTASQVSASPITDGKHIWAFFGSRGLYCLDTDGKVVWKKNLGTMTTRNQFGEGASPVLHGDTIVINWDHEGDSFILALDKLTGEEKWKTPRDEPTSWSTPIVIEDDGRSLVVVSATNKTRAYDIDDGGLVWEAAGLGVNCVPTPIEDSGLLFVMSGYRNPAAMAIRYAGAKGDISGSDRIVWRIETGTSYVPSAVLVDGQLYFLTKFSGVLSGYDLKSGKPLYEQPQRLEGLSNVYSSLVATSDRVYAVDRDGAAVVFRTGKKFKMIAQSQLDDQFDASPAIAGDELYLRGHEHLYCVAKN